MISRRACVNITIEYVGASLTCDFGKKMFSDDYRVTLTRLGCFVFVDAEMHVLWKGVRKVDRST